jgi:hypothetical protein
MFFLNIYLDKKTFWQIQLRFIQTTMPPQISWLHMPAHVDFLVLRCHVDFQNADCQNINFIMRMLTLFYPLLAAHRSGYVGDR